MMRCNPDDLKTCTRCGGHGRLPQFPHVEGGMCFECHGTGVSDRAPRRPPRDDGRRMTALDHARGAVMNFINREEVARLEGHPIEFDGRAFVYGEDDLSWTLAELRQAWKLLEGSNGIAFHDSIPTAGNRMTVPQRRASDRLLAAELVQTMHRLGFRRNPDDDDDDDADADGELPNDFEDAVEGFKRFQQLEPRQIGTFKGLVIPKTMTCVGEGVHVLYRSDKWGEGTHDYIHEHEGGVYACRADDEADGERMAVPAAAQKATALYYLGDCLGFRYITEANETVDAKGRRPLPELYATPDGKTLFVIEVDGPRAKVVAALWGGKLDVRPEGIVG